MIEIVWFCLVAIMIAGYVVLDGFDLGAGIIHLFVARTEQERRRVLASIGPVWDGNEVWLIAGGGTLYFAFPLLYASSFSGFYLPLNMVLWLLVLRGIGIEFRMHIENQVWQSLFDGFFAISSALLAVFFGAALGNVVRGVPLGVHVTAAVRPRTMRNFSEHPLAYVIPLVVAVSLAAMWVFERRAKEKAAFLSSCAYILAMLAGVAAALYPSLLPSSIDPARDITTYNAATGTYALRVGLIWWGVGMCLAIGYFVFVYRMFRGKVRPEEGH